MYIIMLSVGALFGGLYLGGRDLFPYLAAMRNGVITRKGALGVRVRRDEDPERFGRLMANRRRSVLGGFGLSALGAAVLGLFWLAVRGVPLPLVILMTLISLGFCAFAAYCLARGFATGRMFAFWSLILFGEAERKENPTWFWTYTAINVVIVLLGALNFLTAIMR